MKYIFTLLLFSFATSTLAANDASFSATYHVYWKGFHVFTSNVGSQIKGTNYHATADFYPRGFAKIFVSGKSDVTSSGVISSDGTVQSKEWRVDGKWDGDITRRHVTFDNAGKMDKVDLQIPEDWQDYPLKPIPDEFKKGMDPMSLLVAGMRGPWARSDLTAPYQMDVIDGQAVIRYTMTCAEKMDILPVKKSRSPMAGEAVKCELAMKRLAGFVDENKFTDKQRKKFKKQKVKAEKARKKAEKRKAAGKSKPKDKIIVWFQKMDDLSLYLPVRAEMRGNRGNVSIYLSKLDKGMTDTAKAR